MLIRGCLVDVGEDNISFKSTRGEPPLDGVVVQGCTFKGGRGVSMGSNLGSGVRNVVVQNCAFDGTSIGLRIKSARDRGAVVENITYRDLTMKNVGTVTTFNLFFSDKEGMKARATKPVTETTPVVRNVQIVNLTCEDAKSVGEIVGLPEMPVTGVLLDKVRVRSQKGLHIQDANKVELRDVEIIPQKGQPYTAEHADIKVTQSTVQK